MSGGTGGRRASLTLPAWAARLALVLTAASLAACGQKAEDDKGRVTSSGLPVPRYVSLKFDQVNARSGPGDDHRLLWVYHARGLPLQVVAEAAEWRRVCDADGALSWVNRRTTDGRRTVMPLGQAPLPLRAQPKDGARVIAFLAPRAIANFDRCAKDWCRIRAGAVTGWAPAAAVWGVADAPQCPKPGGASTPAASAAQSSAP